MEHCGGDDHVSKYVHTPTLLFCCPLVLSLDFFPLTPIAFIFTFSRCSFFLEMCQTITRHRPPYSVHVCLCIQRGHFQVEHCGGDVHGFHVFWCHCVCSYHLLHRLGHQQAQHSGHVFQQSRQPCGYPLHLQPRPTIVR